MANSAIVGTLRILLTADTAEFQTELAKAGRAADKWAKDLDRIGTQAQTVGKTLTAALTVPLAGLATSSVKAAMDFESSFAGVRKTVNATEPELRKLSAGFRALATTIPINVNELNRIGEAAGQLGIKTSNILGFTEVVAKLGVTTNLSTDQAATSLARLANITQMPQSQFDRLGSTIVALGNNFATTESEITDFGLRIAGAGHLAGLTEPQILAIGTAMSSVGVEAEAGGTAVQKVLLGMTEAVATGGKTLETFAATAGMSAEQFRAAWQQDAGAAFAAFVQGLGQQGDQAFKTLEALDLTDQRLIRSFLSLAGAGDLLTRSLQVGTSAWQQNTALIREAEQRFATTSSQLTLLWNRVKDVGITLGNALLPTINLTIHAVDTLLPIVARLADLFAHLSGPVQAAVIGLGAVAAATGPVLYIFGTLARSTSDIIALFGKKGIATRLLAGELVTLDGVGKTLTGTLGLLGKAAGVAAAAFVGWQIGRLIADLTGLDQKIANTITGFDNLRAARQRAAQGDVAGAQAEVTARLTALEEQRTAALHRMDLVTAGLLTTQINALKHDQQRLAIQDTITLAIQRGAAASITYAEAIKFNAEWAKTHADQLKRTADHTAAAGAAAGTAAAQTKTLAAASRESASAMAQQASAAQQVANRLSGADAIKEATLYLAALKQLPPVQRLTRDAQQDINRVMAAALTAYQTLGREAPQAIRDTYNATFDLAKALDALKVQDNLDALKDLGGTFRADVTPAIIPLIPVVDGLGKEFAQLGATGAVTLPPLVQRTHDWGEALDGLSRSFAQMAQIAGDAFGGILQDIGQMIALMATAARGISTFAQGLSQLRDSDRGNNGQGWMNLLTGGASTGTSLWAATNPENRSTGANIASGAMTWGAAGAQIGSVIPGLGTLAGWSIGAFAGAIVSWWRSSHQQWRAIGQQVGDWLGHGISESLAKKLDEIRKTLEGGTRQQRQEWAALIGLPQIIAEEGGLNDSNIRTFEQQAEGLFEIIQRGGPNAAQAYQTLNTLVGQFAAYAESAGGMWDETFKSLIAQARELGINLDSVNQAIDQQINKLASGLARTEKGAFAGTDKALANLNLSPDVLSTLRSGDEAAIDRLDLDPAVLEKLKDITADAQGAFDRMSRSALAAFNTIIANGHTAAEAMAMIGPTIDDLIARHDQLGLEGGAAYEQLARFRTLTKDNEDLISSVGGLNDMLVALSNLGGLNADTLADLEAQGLEAFNQLTAAGFTQDEALRQMAPLLESIIKAHKDLGIPIDENTQKLIDQAEAQGILKEEGMDTNSILIEGISALIEAVGGELPESFRRFRDAAVDAAKKAGKAIDDIPTTKTIDISVLYPDLPPPGTLPDVITRDDLPDRFPDLPGSRFPEGDHHPGTYATGGRVLAFALGGRVPEEAAHLAGGGMGRLLTFTPKGTDTIPAMLTEGEWVLTAAQQQAVRDALAAAGSGYLASTLAVEQMAQMVQQSVGREGQGVVIMEMDKREVGRAVADVLPGELRRLGVRVRA